ncbi:MAG TPA: PD-(D/E)XK nuclease family protein, partial [Tianweitania sediminis]|nr:PD-(D/E)XK nuclease family protein [Tianweitania sediminis]
GRIGGAWPAGEREAALQSVFAVIEDPAFAPLFAPGSRAEVGVMGTLDVGSTPRAIAGTVDRLVVTENAVLIVDYKTNRPAPQDLPAVPGAYVVQLALYRALLKEIYPGKAVSAALLFTEGPILIPLPHQIMDEALKKLRVGSQDGTPLQG